jgi:hypothetical protein
MKAKKLSIFVILLLCSIVIFSQKDYSQKLKKDLVKIEAGKFIIEDLLLLKLSNDKNIQCKFSAICPIEIMSRDNFISLYKTWCSAFINKATTNNEFKLTKIIELDELIGEPDLSCNFVMAKNGVQIQTEIFKEKNNYTGSWEEVLEEPI